MRLHLLGFYAFARFVDEIGDAYEGDRLAALDEVENQTRAALHDPDLVGALPVVATAARSVSELDADPSLLFDLIAANRQDQTVSAYDTFNDLLAYCALSANPVGRLVLAAFRASREALFAWSDSICTGLQLAEHWQDVAEDAAAGRDLPSSRRPGPIRRRAGGAHRRPAGQPRSARPVGLRGGPGAWLPRPRATPDRCAARARPAGRLPASGPVATPHSTESLSADSTYSLARPIDRVFGP